MTNYNHRKNTITLKNGQEIDVWRVNNDLNGNPRYVVHYLSIADNFETAKKQLNAATYRAKWFGGGLVFSTYNLKDRLEKSI